MQKAKRSSPSNLSQLGERLKELRNLRSVSQVDLASILGIGQTALSHAESRNDMKVSTLWEYISALGGNLELVAHFPDLGRKQLSPAPATSEPDLGEQLVLPGIPVQRKAARDVVLSIKPRYAEKIMDGSKTVELRRRFSAAVPAGARAWIYSTTPTKAMIGAATITRVEQLSTNDIWRRYKDVAAVSKQEFNEYFSGRDDGYAIVLSSPLSLHTPVPLADLRSNFEFEPPQSYQYAPPQLSKFMNGDWTKAPN
jgi:predicted transcriptional regulator